MARRQDSVDTVELNEITNVGGDPELAYGSLGGTNAVIAPNQGLQYLAQAGRLKAEANQFKYLQFQENLKNFYNRFDDVKVDGIMEADYPVINQEYADLAREIADNYDVIRNPNKDPEKFAQIKEREALLRGRISRSKQDVAYRTAHDTFIRANPEFNTQANKARIEDFNKKTIGERQLYNLDTPFVYDPNARATIANNAAQTKLKEDKTNGRYFTTQEETQYLQDEFDRAWDATATMQDKTGRPIVEAATDAYGKIYGPDVVKNNFAVIDRQIGRSLMKQGEKTTAMRVDQYGLQDDQQAADALLQARRLAAQKELADDKTLRGFGRLYAETWTNAFTTGVVDPSLAQTTWGDDSEIEVTVTEGKNVFDANNNPVPVTEKKTKVPKIVAKSGGLDADGNLIIERYDNEKGVALAPLTVTKEEGRQSFYKIAGARNAQGVAAETERYLRENNLGRNVELQPLQKHFEIKGDALNEYSNVRPATYKGQRITVGIKDGKYYNVKTGEEIK